ncbi:MAG: phosphopantetheine-binding protein [Actinomycetota bacterium]
MTLAPRILEFVKNEVLVEDHEMPISDDTPLLRGLVDSVNLFRLVAFLEEEFDIEIDELEITAENFGTIADIARLVDRTRRDTPEQSDPGSPST